MGLVFSPRLGLRDVGVAEFKVFFEAVFFGNFGLSWRPWSFFRLPFGAVPLIPGANFALGKGFVSFEATQAG